MTMKPVQVCSICGGAIVGFGNSAQPVTHTVADPLPRPLGAPPHLTRRFETFFTAD
jgi:hypothetical protein